MRINFQFSPKADTLDYERIAEEIKGMGARRVVPLFTQDCDDLLCGIWMADVTYETYEGIMTYLTTNPMVKYAEINVRR